MFLGIDIGTSSTKVLLTDEKGQPVGSATHHYDVSRPQALWSEQDPQDWVKATLAAIDELASRFPDQISAVRGMGYSGQMHGATLLDAGGHILRPCILWNDGRSFAECAELEAGLPDLHAITGNLAMPGFTAPKLLWVKKHEPEIFAKTATVLLPKAYVRYVLSGEMIEEMSDASGTLWLDVAARDWSDKVLAATGLSRAHMPKLVEGSQPAGHLKAEYVARWKMAQAPVMAGGAGDCAASAIGLGAIAPGDAFLSLGTSGVLWATTDRFAPNPGSAVHAFCHAIPDTWHQMGVMLSAAASLSWLAGILGAREAELLAELEGKVSGPSGVAFLPYLAGERTPHNDPKLRGLFAGLGADHGRADMVQAVLEGVAFATADNLAALRAGGTDIYEIDLAGGGSRSALWAQILADILQIPVHRIEDGEVGAALGAARLAILAVGSSLPSTVCTRPRRLQTFTPSAASHAYQAARQRWRTLCQAALSFSRA